MKRLIKKADEASFIKVWDGSKKMLSRVNKLTKGIFTDEGILYVWKDNNLHHANAQQILGIDDCAHIVIDIQANTINVEYPRGAHSVYNEKTNNGTNVPANWFESFKIDSEELFNKDVNDIQSLFPNWTVTRRQFNQANDVVAKFKNLKFFKNYTIG